MCAQGGWWVPALSDLWSPPGLAWALAVSIPQRSVSVSAPLPTWMPATLSACTAGGANFLVATAGKATPPPGTHGQEKREKEPTRGRDVPRNHLLCSFLDDLLVPFYGAKPCKALSHLLCLSAPSLPRLSFPVLSHDEHTTPHHFPTSLPLLPRDHPRNISSLRATFW